MRPKVQIIYDSQSKRVLTERYINLPEHSLLYIMDSVSERELIELSEASYLVTKKGQKTPDSTKEEPESDAQPQIQDTVTKKQFDQKEVPRLTKARAAKPKSPLAKRALLVLAVLFLVAGGVWQFLADDSVNGQDREIEQTAPRSGETPQSEVINDKSPSPDPARPPLETNQKQQVSDGTPAPSKTVAALYEKTAPQTPLSEKQKNTEMGKRQESGTIEKEVKIGGSAAQDNPASEMKPPADVSFKEIGPPDSARYPYSILLASFRQASSVERLTNELKTKGIDPYWVKVDLGTDGIWYRVFTGFYVDTEQARLIIEQNDLKGALPKSTRFATWIGGFHNRQQLKKEIAELSTSGFSAYSIEDEDNVAHLFVGAFFTRKGAETQSAILNDAGFESTVVER